MGFGDLGRMAIHFQGAGSTVHYFQGFGEQAHCFGDLGSPAKSKKFNLHNLTLKEKPSFRLIFKKIFGFWEEAPQTTLGKSQCISFRVNMLIGLG